VSQDRSTPEAAIDLPLELVELTACVERLLDEHERVRGERDALGRRLAAQDAEMATLRARLAVLLRGRETARQRLDGVIGHLNRLESRAQP
jgi:hypothetical protein